METYALHAQLRRRLGGADAVVRAQRLMIFIVIQIYSKHDDNRKKDNLPENEVYASENLGRTRGFFLRLLERVLEIRHCKCE